MVTINEYINNLINKQIYIYIYKYIHKQMSNEQQKQQNDKRTKIAQRNTKHNIYKPKNVKRKHKHNMESIQCEGTGRARSP